MSTTLASAIALWTFFGACATGSRRRQEARSTGDSNNHEAMILKIEDQQAGQTQKAGEQPGLCEMILAVVAVVVFVVYIIGPYLPDTTMIFGP